MWSMKHIRLLQVWRDARGWSSSRWKRPVRSGVAGFWWMHGSIRPDHTEGAADNVPADGTGALVDAMDTLVGDPGTLTADGTGALVDDTWMVVGDPGTLVRGPNTLVEGPEALVRGPNTLPDCSQALPDPSSFKRVLQDQAERERGQQRSYQYPRHRPDSPNGRRPGSQLFDRRHQPGRRGFLESERPHERLHEAPRPLLC